jgi:cell division protein FtsB
MNSKKNNIINILLVFLLIYLVFHTIYGNRGIVAYYTLNKEVSKLSNQADDVFFKRILLEKQVKDLNAKNIDKDLIDEYARKLLLLSEPDEEIIINILKE